jgi:hypothetical protein
MLHEVSSGTIETRHIVTPVRTFIKKANFYEAIQSIDLQNKKVIITHKIGKQSEPTPYKQHVLEYDYLVIALGSLHYNSLLTTSYYNAAFAQQQKKGLVVVSDNGFNDNDPTLPQYHIVGEVQNNGSETAKFEVSATLYDSNNKVIGTESTFTKPSDIDPGQKAPFEITVGTDKLMGGDLSIIHHYAVQASSQVSD